MLDSAGNVIGATNGAGWVVGVKATGSIASFLWCGTFKCCRRRLKAVEISPNCGGRRQHNDAKLATMVLI